MLKQSTFKNRLARLLPLGLTLLAAACTQAGFAAINLPTYFDGTKTERDIAFGPAAWERLDIYEPPATDHRPHEVIVFYYGGRWETGSKEEYRFVGSTLAKQGYIVVIPDYRKYPDVKFPVFVQDSAKSLAWVADNIARYGGDPQHIHLSGHSAGAHIAALLTTDPRYLKAEGKDRAAVIRDFAGLAGPYDFTPDEKDLIDIFGPPAHYPQMQATTFVTGHEPPMLLLWGDGDKAVGRRNIDKFATAIRAHDGKVETKIYPGVTHTGILTSLSWLGSAQPPVAADMTAFFAEKK